MGIAPGDIPNHGLGRLQGEPAVTPVAPAIANAVADAIGVRVYELPITPERVLVAIRKQQAAD